MKNNVCVNCGVSMPAYSVCITSCVSMAMSLFLSFVLYDLEGMTFTNAAAFFILLAKVHGNLLCIGSPETSALAEVFGRCDSDDSPDADNGNGFMIVWYTALHTQPRIVSLALCLTWALHQVRGMALLLCVISTDSRGKQQENNGELIENMITGLLLSWNLSIGCGVIVIVAMLSK